METLQAQVSKLAPGLATLLHKVKDGNVANNDQAVAGIYENFFRSTQAADGGGGRRSQKSDRRVLKRPS